MPLCYSHKMKTYIATEITLIKSFLKWDNAYNPMLSEYINTKLNKIHCMVSTV